MRRNGYISFILLVLFLYPQIGYALPVQTENREIVVYAGSKKVNTASLEVKDVNREGNIFIVPGSELTEVKEKQKKGEIEAWGYREKYTVAVTPNDTYYSSQWAPPKIDAPTAWDVTAGSTEVIIAVIDTGFQLTHPDLSAKFITGYDYVDNDSDPSLPAGGGDRYYHGTLVAGAASASTNNAVGVAGIDWSAKVMPIRVMDNDGVGYTDDIAGGIDYARTHGADIINLSLGYNPGAGEEPDPVLEAAINNAYTAGVTVVAASGNENTDVSYPAAFDNVIAVGATNQSDERCDESDWGAGAGSNYGPELDVVAPGNGIYTTSVSWNGSSYVNGYATSSGTSLASPIVAGLSGLLEAREDFTPLESKNMITGAAEKVAGMGSNSRTDEYGYGRINAYNTVMGVDPSKISLNSFRITMEDVTTPLDDTDYVLADYPAVGEPVSVRAVLKNDNDTDINLANVRIKGLLSSGTQFTVGTVPALTLGANTTTAVDVQTFNITSFYTHTFSIDYDLNSIESTPYVKPTYSYQQIKAHYPNVKTVKTPVFVPSPAASYESVRGVFKLKNYDARPAYLRSAMIWSNLDGNLYYFSSEAPRLIPSEVYYYEKSIIPYRKGVYNSYIEITYGNGSKRVPASLSSTSSYGSFSVY